MAEDEQICFTDRKQWRAWLKKNHVSSKGIWLVYYKKHTGRPRIPYGDAVEEALCFGWIDTTIKRLDDERYMQKYTPRNPRSVWSRLNKERAERMIKARRMTRAGLARIEEAKRCGTWDRVEKSTQAMRTPPDLKRALDADKTAARNFKNFAPSYRRNYIGWLLSAKREETRRKRIKEIVRRSAKNLKPGML